MAAVVLVVAPHPDDESIGCGGMICLHRQRGDPVHVVFLTSGERGLEGVPAETVWSIREAEAREAGRVLGVASMDFLRLPDLGLEAHVEQAAEQLRGVIETRRPKLIYLPHPEETHADHAAAFAIVRAAQAQCNVVADVPELIAYEVWTPMPRSGWVEDVTPVMRQKMQAIGCYRSQLQQFRYDRAIRGLNQYRGIMQAGSSYAEAFDYLDADL
jgi:LmbE family N-acetylglucosaminyl deacetylase